MVITTQTKKRTTDMKNPINISEGALALFTDLAEDAGNWSGQPLFDYAGSDLKRNEGYLTQLKKLDLVSSFSETGRKDIFGTTLPDIVHIEFTDGGQDLAHELGIDLGIDGPDDY
jgi:hypothetical protein